MVSPTLRIGFFPFLLLLATACGAARSKNTDGDADVDADSDSDTDADTDADSDADTDADSDADGDSDADADADSDADGDADGELCNGLDDDQDGQVDEGDPQAGLFCDSGLIGACAIGRTACVDGALECPPDIPPVVETCANPIEDDDCNGVIDDVPAVGAPCDTGIPGRCAAGTGACDGLDPTCLALLEPRVEQCANVIDDDCDGSVDEAECDDVITCDELEDPVQSAMDACLLVFANCWDDGSAGVIGTIAGCSGCNCDPIDNWQMFCYLTGQDTYNCAACTLGEIQRSHEPCNCNAGTTPAIGTWCPQS